MQLLEVTGDAHVHARDEAGFRGVGRGDDDGFGTRARHGVDERERPRHGAHRAVETQLAEHADAVEYARRQPSIGGDQRERDRELQPRSGLAHRRRRQVHRDALHRILETGGEHGRAHALARLSSGGVGKTDERVSRKAS